MTESERLHSLQQWAEEQKYVRPGEGGTLPTGPRNISAMAFGGPMPYSKEPQYTASIGPPSYGLATAPEPEKKVGPVKRWLEKRRESKAEKKGEDSKEQTDDKPPEYS